MIGVVEVLTFGDGKHPRRWDILTLHPALLSLVAEVPHELYAVDGVRVHVQAVPSHTGIPWVDKSSIADMDVVMVDIAAGSEVVRRQLFVIE